MKQNVLSAVCVGATTVRDDRTDESQTMRGERCLSQSETSEHFSYLDVFFNPSHTDVLYSLFIEDKNITFTAQPDSYQSSNTNPEPSDK